VAQGVPDRLRSRIFLTFGTTRVVGRQSYAPAAFTTGEIPGTHFQRLSRPQGTWFRRWLRKKSSVTPQGIDPETVRPVAQCLNHYAPPIPWISTKMNCYPSPRPPPMPRTLCKYTMEGTIELSILNWKGTMTIHLVSLLYIFPDRIFIVYIGTSAYEYFLNHINVSTKLS
jgi:hypothetical protein